MLIRLRTGFGGFLLLDVPVFLCGTLSVYAYYLLAQHELGRLDAGVLRSLPGLILMDTGLAVNNTVAVIEGFRRDPGEFVRTPKFSLAHSGDGWRGKQYRSNDTWVCWLELGIGAYFSATVMIAIQLAMWAGGAVSGPVPGRLPVHRAPVAGPAASRQPRRRTCRVMSIGPVDAVIAAAGSGARLGAGTPKAFVEVGGVPLLRYVLDVVEALGVRRTVVAVPADDIDRWTERVFEIAGRPLRSDHPLHVVAGGATRQASVRAALEALQETTEPAGDGSDHIVMVHDAARPCASLDLWRRVADAAMVSGAAIPVLPSVDSLKKLDAGGDEVRSDRSRPHRAGANAAGLSLPDVGGGTRRRDGFRNRSDR